MNQNILKLVSEQIRPSAFMDVRQYLDSVYYQMKVYRKPYSYRKFADDLGFKGSTVIHQIIKGYRPLTLKTAARIAAVLHLPAEETEYFLTLAKYNRTTKPKVRDELFTQLVSLKQSAEANPLHRDWLTYCSTWYHPVIREMVAIPAFQESAAWIRAKMNVELSDEEIVQSLQLLERLGLIARDKKGVLQLTQQTVTTGSRVRGMGLVRYHQEMITQGRSALARVRGKRRNISAVTVACDDKTLGKMNALIDDLRNQLLALAEESDKDQVYQMNIQLFPFTE